MSLWNFLIHPRRKYMQLTNILKNISYASLYHPSIVISLCVNLVGAQ